jgi:hypothetical protein
MAISSNNVDNFIGNSNTSSNNANAFPVTVGSSGPTLASWNTVDELDWTTVATSAILSGAGSAVIGPKTVTNATVGGVPVYQTQAVNGQGLVFTIISGLAGSGSACFRYDLDTTLFQPGEMILVDLVISGITDMGSSGTQIWGFGNGANFAAGEWYGTQVVATSATLETAYVRRESASGGVVSQALQTGITQNANWAVQILYDGYVGAWTNMKEGATDYLTRPAIGSATPWAAGSGYIGHSGTTSAIAIGSGFQQGQFGTTMRIICGCGTVNTDMTLVKHRLSRLTRTV